MNGASPLTSAFSGSASLTTLPALSLSQSHCQESAENSTLPQSLSVRQGKPAAKPEHACMVFLDNVMFAAWYLPSLFLSLPLPRHSTVWSKNITFLAAKAVKSLCMFLLLLLSLFFFFFFSGLSFSCVDFVALLSKIKHLENHSVGYAFSSFCLFGFF